MLNLVQLIVSKFIVVPHMMNKINDSCFSCSISSHD
jgi:hypothetical protein